MGSFNSSTIEDEGEAGEEGEKEVEVVGVVEGKEGGGYDEEGNSAGGVEKEVVKGMEEVEMTEEVRWWSRRSWRRMRWGRGRVEGGAEGPGGNGGCGSVEGGRVEGGAWSRRRW